MKTESSRPRGRSKSSRARRGRARDFIGDVAIDPDGHLLYACDLYHDAIVVVNTQSGIVIDRFKTGRRPYRILFNPDGKSFYVTSWADGSLYHHQTSNGALVQTLRLGAHPTDMVWRDRATRAEEGEEGETAQQPSFKARIFVSAANTNNVYSVGVSDSGDLRVVETINVSTTPEPSARHDAQRAGAQSRSKPFVCGLLGRQCRRGGGCYRRRAARCSASFPRVGIPRPRGRWPTAAWWC